MKLTLGWKGGGPGAKQGSEMPPPLGQVIRSWQYNPPPLPAPWVLSPETGRRGAFCSGGLGCIRTKGSSTETSLGAGEGW